MSVQQKLEHDQDKIKMLFHDIENLGDDQSDLRQPLFVKLKEEIKLLYQAEKDVVQEAINDSSLPDEIHEKKKSALVALEDLERVRINSDEWHDKLSAFKDKVFNQVDYSQEMLTPIIDDIVEQPEELADGIVEHKEDQVNVTVLEMPPKS